VVDAVLRDGEQDASLMHRLIQLLFWVSDILAWLLVALSALAVVTYPFFGPASAAMERETLTSSEIVVTCLWLLSVAVGAWLVTRRRATGVALIVASVFVARGAGGWPLAATLALVFGLPFLLVFCRRATPRSAP
jgi:hypothetical protein